MIESIMIVDSMTHTEVYQEIDKDMDEVARWWEGKRKILTGISKWTTKLPFSRWYEYESTRKNRYLVMSIIMGRKYNDESLTGVLVLRKMDRGYAVYISRFPWQHRACPHVLLQHVLDQYHNPERGNVPKTGVELIKHFFERNSYGEISRGDKFSGRSVRYKGRDNICKSVTDGVLLGEMADNIFIAHTFITYDMATGLQREEFEKNNNMILTNDEIMSQFKQEMKEEERRLREEAIEMAMKYKTNKLINV